VAPRPLPLMAVAGATGRPFGDTGHAGAEVVGRLDRVTVADNVVYVEGMTELPAGEYPCGMDLRDVSGVLVTEGGAPLVDGGELELDPDGGLVQLFTAGTLIAVTVYLPDSGRRPAFEVARLVVEEAAA
jgi:hypothetical protein